MKWNYWNRKFIMFYYRKRKSKCLYLLILSMPPVPIAPEPVVPLTEVYDQ